VRQQKSLMPDKPFFMYFAPGATHAPHHVPKEWSDKYKGRSTRAGTRCARRPRRRRSSASSRRRGADRAARRDPAWDDMPDELKPVLARQMEVYAGFLEHTDHHVGRLVDALEDLGVLDDTLVYYIIGDNGASAEGTPTARSTRWPSSTAPRARDARVHGRAHRRVRHAEAYNHYAVGWAHAMDTPYQWTKQVASHWGGTRNGTIVHWPRGIAARARSARSSTTSSTSPRRSSRPPGCPSRRSSTASSRCRSRA
jgi:arylsulfatase A-like enzyme